MAYAVWYMQPLLMRHLVSERGYSEFAGGVIISGEMCVMAIASTLIARFGNRLRIIAAWGLITLTAASAWSVLARSYVAFALARIWVGAGTGAMLMMANSLAAGFADPDKVFARTNFINLICGMLLVAIAPWLQEEWPAVTPYALVFLYMALCGLLVLVQLASAPNWQPMEAGTEQGRSEAKVVDSGASSRKVWLVVAVVVLVGLSAGVIWPFYALIGVKTGLSQSAVDSTIAVALFMGLLSTGLASFMGSTFGRFWPITVSMLLLSGSVVVLTANPTPVLFRWATCVNTASLQFMIPYLFGSAASQGTDGRGAVYAGSAFFVTGAAGPTVGGLLMGSVGARIFGFVALIVAALGIGIMFCVERKKPQVPVQV
jgi:predicted MFS family arabinose efflux permease